MGPSVGFVRGYLALWAFAALVAIALGGLNELLDLGLFAGGYPTVGDDDGFGSFALQAAAAAVALLGLGAALGHWDR